MKRRTLALALCIGLSACSGQNNKDTNRGLGSGDRDAEADAGVEPTEDGEVPPDEEDAAEPAEDGATSEDAGSPNDAGTASDGSSLDGGGGGGGDGGGGGADASPTDAGDAGGADATKLRIKVPFGGPLNGAPFPGYYPTVLFSLADGGVESVRRTDDAGVVVSDTAPAMVTAMLNTESNGLENRGLLVTVLAPQLGDSIEFWEPRGRIPEEPRTPAYQLSPSALPGNWYSVQAFAGVDGCAQGYQGLEPAPTGPLAVGKYSNCELEMPGTLLAQVRNFDNALLAYGAVQVPAAATLPAAAGIDQWVTPETLTATLTGTQTNNNARAELWLRKGRLRVVAESVDSPQANQFPFLVARSLVDS
ncbi:MAG TPA: hypothetical protein VFZ61_18065, partial [Polyangiales bacterium]